MEPPHAKGTPCPFCVSSCVVCSSSCSSSYDALASYPNSAVFKDQKTVVRCAAKLAKPERYDISEERMKKWMAKTRKSS